MTPRMHRLIFMAALGAWVGLIIAAANAQENEDIKNFIATYVNENVAIKDDFRRINDIKVAFRQCSARMNGYTIVWNPNQKRLPPDIKASHCWTDVGMIDQETVDYYDMIGAGLEGEKK